MRWILFPTDTARVVEMGGKARALAALHRAALPIPDWFVVSGGALNESLGAAAITTGHLTIGAGSIVLARAVVTKDVKRGGRVGGYPAQDVHAWRRETATLRLMSKGRNGGRQN